MIKAFCSEFFLMAGRKVFSKTAFRFSSLSRPSTEPY